MNAPVPEHQAVISLGSNIDPEENLVRALALLCQRARVQAISRAWENPPVGSRGPNFVNAAAAVLTPCDPEELKTNLLRPIEQELGRVRGADRFAPRPIDLDVVVWDGLVQDERLWTLAFLAVPISELLPDYPHPDGSQTLGELGRLMAAQPEMQLDPALTARLRQALETSQA